MKTEDQKERKDWRKQQIIDHKDDILIANFLGKTVYDGKGENGVGKWKGQARDYEPFELQYKTDWNWLMPVVEKIMLLEYDNGEDHAYLRTFGKLSATNKPLVRFNRCAVWEGKTLIEATYNAVIDFIKSQP